MTPKAVILFLAAIILLQGCEVEQKSAAQASTKLADDQPIEVEPVSGIDKDALAAIMGLGNQYGVFYYPDRIDPRQLKNAPARLCAKRKATVAEVKDTELHHPEELPGARHLVVHCSG